MLLRTTNPAVQARFLSLAMATAACVATSSFANDPSAQLDRSGGSARRHVHQLLDKDDNDVVIKTEELPKAIRDYIAKEMPDAKIAEARKDYKGNKERTGDNFTYEVDVKDGKKEYELRFTPDGKLLKKRENAGDQLDR